jgi:hypothetical protein
MLAFSRHDQALGAPRVLLYDWPTTAPGPDRAMPSATPSFRDRIDWPAALELERRALPEPVDALNLVCFADEVSYRWYGMLLAPRLLILGAWPVWVATREETLLGGEGADEIVIIRYPTHRILVRAVMGRYYALVNRLREKGVRSFEFSITERVLGGPELRRGELFLVAQYNPQHDEEERCLHGLRAVLETGARRIVYGSREVAHLAIFKPMLPSDPNRSRYANTAVFSLPDMGVLADLREQEALVRLQTITSDLSLHVYRRLPSLQAMPWARRGGGAGVPG